MKQVTVTVPVVVPVMITFEEVDPGIWEARNTEYYDYEIRRFGQQYQVAVLHKGRCRAWRRFPCTSMLEAQQTVAGWEENCARKAAGTVAG